MRSGVSEMAQDAQDYDAAYAEMATTHIAPTIKADEVELAWSKEGEAPERQPWLAAWKNAGMLAVAGVALAVIVGVVGWMAFIWDDSAPSATSTTTASATATPSLSVDDAFLAAVERRGIAIRDRKNAVQDAHTLCSMLANGQTRTDAVDAMKAANPTAIKPQLAQFVDLSIHFYCPA